MKLVYKVEGAAELAATLRELGKEVAGKVIGPSLGKAAKPIAAEAKRLVPVDTGALKRSIGVTVTRPKKDRAQFALIGSKAPKGEDRKKTRAYIGRFLEFGTSKMQARPWLRPAFDVTRATAEKTLVAELRKGIDNAANILARKRKK